MERLDFASAMGVLRRNINEEICPSQLDLIEVLFRDMRESSQSYMEFDNGQVCKWMNGLAKLSPRVISHYQGKQNQRALAQTIENRILPMMPDSAMAVQELYDLLMQAPNVSPQKKAELTEGISFGDENEAAVFMTEVLCLSMQLRYEKRDIREPLFLVPGSSSPVVKDYLFNSDVPKSCRWFVGRKTELTQLHEMLMDHSKVFLHGIPGIGKSELAKAYAKEHRKEYTNILYLNCPQDLRHAISNMDFLDDLPTESEDARFLRHSRFLRSLREDTLLIVDNFNETPGEDAFLDELLKYRLRILFTTRSRYEEQPSLEVKELDKEELLALMGNFCEVKRNRETVGEIISLLHGHTFAVELAARLLAGGMLRPKALVQKLQKERAALDTDDEIRVSKDGKTGRAVYRQHLQMLFGLFRLSGKKREVLRNMTLMPLTGVPSRMFGSWLGLRNLNSVNRLIEMGLIQPEGRYMISLHPMIREVTLVEIPPSVRACAALIQSLQEICLRQGEDLPWYRLLFQLVENVIAQTQKDDAERYLRFLEDTFCYMEKYGYESGLTLILSEMDTLLRNPQVGKPEDRALFLDCRASRERNLEKAIALTHQAIDHMPDIGRHNGLLASNLYANLGGRYRTAGKFEPAQRYMEEGLRLLQQYGQGRYHDMLAQVSNYSVLLANIGKTEEAVSVLEELRQLVMEAESDKSLDFAGVLEAESTVYLMLGNLPMAIQCRQKARAIYEEVYGSGDAFLSGGNSQFLLNSGSM